MVLGGCIIKKTRIDYKFETQVDNIAQRSSSILARGRG